jgi:hypothetical protein
MFTGLFIIAAAAVTIWLVAKAATALFSMRVDYYSHSTMVQDHQAKAALRAAKEAAAKQAALLETVTAFG